MKSTDLSVSPYNSKVPFSKASAKTPILKYLAYERKKSLLGWQGNVDSEKSWSDFRIFDFEAWKIDLGLHFHLFSSLSRFRKWKLSFWTTISISLFSESFKTLEVIWRDFGLGLRSVWLRKTSWGVFEESLWTVNTFSVWWLLIVSSSCEKREILRIFWGRSLDWRAEALIKMFDYKQRYYTQISFKLHFYYNLNKYILGIY